MAAHQAKQYLMLEGLPILRRTLTGVVQLGSLARICLVVPEADIDYCRLHILPEVTDGLDIAIVGGGETRQQSVYSGLSSLPESTRIVIIHDGVRPFFPIGPTREAVRLAAVEGACILGIPLTDTLKRMDGEGRVLGTLPRQDLWQAQTPQVFSYDLIKKAHERALSEKFSGTDDASLVENMGEAVLMIYGSPYNIKITTPEDMVIAKGILRFYGENDAG